MWFLEGAGPESAGIKSSGLLDILTRPGCFYPAQNSVICLFSPSANVSRDIPWLGELPQPGVYGQMGLWSGWVHFINPQAIKLGRESCDLGHTEGHKLGATGVTTASELAPLTDHTQQKRQGNSAFTRKNMGVERKYYFSPIFFDSLFFPHIWWIPILQKLKRNHLFY